MANTKKAQPTTIKQIFEHVQGLESRLDRIESQLKNFGLSEPGYSQSTIRTPAATVSQEQTEYESKVVEYGFAWISAIVYLFGIIFLMAYIKNLGYTFIASLIGYGATAVLFFFSYYLRKSFPHLLSAGQITGLLLLYFVTLRLHFFSLDPIVVSKGIALVLLIITIGVQLYFAIRKQSEFLATISLILVLATALFYNSTYITLTLFALACITSLVLFSRMGWWRLVLFILFSVYIAHALWYLNNPVMGNPLRAVESHQHNIIYLFIYAIVFATTIFIPQKKPSSDGVIISIAIWNAISFTLLTVIVVLGFYQENYTWIFLLITAICLVFSVFLKSGTDRKFAPAFYACFGFMALSVAVYGYSGLPEVYFFLALQSLLVVSMALWFRSRIIVIVNTILFVTILLAYLVTADPINHISFTFAFIALATARIMNWKKERLTLRTENFRNVFLGAGFIMILYSLYYLVPPQYITLSWTASAVLYFILSIILSNVKYRWMSILTLLVSSLRLFIVDLARLEIGYRVIAFLFFAIIAFGVSVYYTKKIKKRT